MDRRSFVRLMAAVPFAPSLKGAPGDPATASALPKLNVVTKYAPARVPGMPGPYPGRVIAVKSEKSVDVETSAANDEVVREMMARGMCALTGKKTPREAWKQFVVPVDVVWIKVNCGGHPWCVSAYEIVAEIIRQLGAAGVPPTQVYVYERFQNQLDNVNYAPHLPEGVTIVAAETANRRADNRGYDPATYVEADLFGEEDTRSSMMKLVSQKLTKIINVPNMKDHGATGATGCLKNIAYGSFSNVARTHYRGNNLFVRGHAGSVELLRSRTVLQIMTACGGLHGYLRAPRSTPFIRSRSFGTDPVANDRLPHIIDDERKRHARSRSTTLPQYFKMDDGRPRRRPERQHHHPRVSTWSSRPASASWRTARIGPDILVWRSFWLAACRVLLTQGVESAPALKKTAIERFVCSRDGAWRKAAHAVPLSDTDLGLRETVAGPACARTAPRDPQSLGLHERLAPCATRGSSYDLPSGGRPGRGGSVRYGADAVLKIDPADLESVGQMLAFLGQLPKDDLPDIADVAVVDDGSATMGEALNLLVRRNLLFKIVPAPSAQYRVSVKLGTPEFPADAAADPSAFALKVRRQLTDEQRSLRIFGTEIVIGRLTGDGSRVRLHPSTTGPRHRRRARPPARHLSEERQRRRPGQGGAGGSRRRGRGPSSRSAARPLGVVDLTAAK